MEAQVAVGIAMVRLGLVVSPPQPSPNTFPHLRLHFAEHTQAVRMMEVADSSPRPNIDAGDDFLGFLPVGAPGCLLPLNLTAQIRRHYFHSPAQQRKLDRVASLLRPSLWSPGEAVLVEVSFKDGQEQQDHCCLHHPIPSGVRGRMACYFQGFLCPTLANLIQSIRTFLLGQNTRNSRGVSAKYSLAA